MSKPVQILFTPFRIGNLTLKNRIVMAPMTRSFSRGSVPGDDVTAYYRRRAEGGVGLILSEGVHPNTTTADGTPNVPDIVTPAAKEGWRKVASEVKAAGGAMGLQLWHEGPYRNPAKSAHPDIPSWSASGLKVPDKGPLWAPMTEAEIETAIEEFVAAAVATKEAGFACAEFHGAHSYLIDSFFWDKTNRRTDKWGGDWTGRTRMAAEIIRRTRTKVGPDFPLIIRISQWKQQDFDAKCAETPQEFEQWLAPLADAGIDAFHCSQRRFWEPAFDGSDLNAAGWAKKLTGKPTISVGSVGLSGEFTATYGGEVSKPASLDRLVEMMERGDFDLIAVGRALLQDPQWAEKVRTGRTDELKEFSKDALGVLY
ncbi:MAG TPA: 12-oxophytodienoate reductase [Parvularcula sp.]|nr:12-oxophytodienoate reductase [Parvularcula sp.]HBS31626.1 12-oxophytodienoate reductase [Parvularcula sp.]